MSGPRRYSHINDRRHRLGEQCDIDPVFAKQCNFTLNPARLEARVHIVADDLEFFAFVNFDFFRQTDGDFLFVMLAFKSGNRRILRLVENLTLGTAAVGYRTESMHGAGSPQAQRIMIARQGNIDQKKKLAKKIAGIDK